MILTAIAIIFILGYLAIALEHPLKVNKSASALFLGTVLWLVWFKGSGNVHQVSEQLFESFGGLAQILFFLMGAMTIVAIIDANDGFSVITSRIKTSNVKVLLWIIAWLSFFLSAVLDNLTTTIVMMTLTRKLISDTKSRLYMAGVIVIAANAGGAWSPIGDVTTTMLWIGGQISALGIVKSLILPSIVCLLLPVIVFTFFISGEISHSSSQSSKDAPSSFEKSTLFIAGIGGLLMVPVIKTVFHVPPYIAMLFILGVLWTVVELLARRHESIPNRLNIHHVIKDVDTPSVLFFAGILLAVGVLEATGQLEALAKILENILGDVRIITIIIGFLSAVVDNVPLVAATMGMYDLKSFPHDHLMWEFIAYCAGTGGSMLVIGSAAGVAAMGIDRNLSFGWYLKRIAPLALLGYLAGAGIYLLMNMKGNWSMVGG
ncbi:MAG: sodium:proton antiporter NhaD [Fibromonadaceae bacterium]|jgi:Na+/H+ antiporter NhaD/arsenite permease-like protein|nr:sodium:proton antiporter NhaD [Fibromonadaceae bacterium]